MKDKIKDCSDTKVSISEMVLPNHTNNLNTLFGGKLMYWMDMAAAICAHKNTKLIAVTASVDNITFKSPIYRHGIDIEPREAITFENSIKSTKT